jgi:hypothetical protein
MSDDELKGLFRIITTNQDSSNRFYNGVLIELQKTVLNTVIKKWEVRMEKLKGRSLELDRLVAWACMGVSFAVTNNLKDLTIDKKSIRLVELFTKIYR